MARSKKQPRRFTEGGPDDPFVHPQPKRSKKSAKKQKQPTIDLVVADWKDTESLLQGIKEILARRGIALQAWDMGSDDWLVSISDKKITAKQYAEAMEFLAEGDPLPEEVDL